MKHEQMSPSSEGQTKSAVRNELLPLMVVSGWVAAVACFFYFLIQRGI